MKKTNAMRILDTEGINYKTYEYEANGGAVDGVTVANKLGKPCENVYKTLITEGVSKTNYCFIIPCNKELNLKKASVAVNEKSIAMIKVNDINKITGYIRGGCSPIGLKKPLATVIDESVNNIEYIIISPGKIGLQMELNPRDLTELINANIKDVIC